MGDLNKWRLWIRFSELGPQGSHWLSSVASKSKCLDTRLLEAPATYGLLRFPFLSRLKSIRLSCTECVEKYKSILKM